MSLPQSLTLPVNLLSTSFNNTSATYKYYWLLAIIHSVEDGSLIIKKKDLFARMISEAWYTVNYFHVSFGKQDLIQEAILTIKEIEQITIDTDRYIVFTKIASSSNKNTVSCLSHFDKNVPHWFLSSWLPKMDRQKIYAASKTFHNKCLYALYPDEIRINPRWVSYLKENAKMLKDFCYWNLALFLQGKNPNVPDIPNKLTKPILRRGLQGQRKFWDEVLYERQDLKCIYTGNPLVVKNYAVEHFIPHNFIAHDLMWNLIPADKSFNCTKSDKLPPLDIYFNKFYNLQKVAFELMREKQPGNKLLQDYLTIFPDATQNFTRQKFSDQIQPLVTIAHNNGFLYF